MNTYYFNDNAFKSTKAYNDFLKENQGVGYLKVKVSAASEAIPIKDVKIIVSKTIGNDTIIFFEGFTNESGIIEKINLPAPKYSTDNLISPLYTTYDIISIYQKENLKQNYKANIFDGIYVLQNINIIPPSIGEY